MFPEDAAALVASEVLVGVYVVLVDVADAVAPGDSDDILLAKQ